MTIRQWVTGAAAVLMSAVMAYGYLGWRDGKVAATGLVQEALVLIASGRGAWDLGPGRLEMLLAVQDPNFFGHNGVDLRTPGAGLTTLTQALAKRVAFADFTPGIGKLRQTTFALAIDQEVPKMAQVALFLNRVEMGRGPDGQWITGFFEASEAVYGRPPALLSDAEFLTLVSVMIAPGQLQMATPDAALSARVARVSAYLAGTCAPRGLRDVWLDGCA